MTAAPIPLALIHSHPASARAPTPTPAHSERAQARSTAQCPDQRHETVDLRCYTDLDLQVAVCSTLPLCYSTGRNLHGGRSHRSWLCFDKPQITPALIPTFASPPPEPSRVRRATPLGVCKGVSDQRRSYPFSSFSTSTRMLKKSSSVASQFSSSIVSRLAALRAATRACLTLMRAVQASIFFNISARRSTVSSDTSPPVRT